MRKYFILFTSGAIFLALKGFVCGTTKVAQAQTDSAHAIYHLTLKTLDGKGTVSFSDYKGKKILIVNTASECGYTPQYEGLEKLYQAKKGKLVIVGCPCNQFGGQEPGDSAEIRQFCTSRYAVTFPLTEKLDVKGKDQHPLYAWLTQKSQNGVLDTEVGWNFNKYLISETGQLLAYFPSKVKPDDPELLKLIDK